MAGKSNNPNGRPLKFGSPKELQEKIEAYFRECGREEDSRVLEHGQYEIQEEPELKGEAVIMKE